MSKKERVIQQLDQINDLRLQPLTDPDSKVLFQFFVLEVKVAGCSPRYEISYAWCIVTSNPEVSDRVYISAPVEIQKDEHITSSFYKLSIYNYSPKAIQIANDLLAGSSLKASLNTKGFDTSKMDFDAQLTEASNNNVIVRPIIINETSTILSRSFFGKYSLNSPFKNVPSFSLILSCLDKLSTFLSIEPPVTDWSKILLPALDYLTAETTLAFSTSGSSRYRNVEFINTQCANQFEVHYAWSENQKQRKKNDVTGSEHSTSKRLTVTILPNPFTSEKELVVNCYLANGGQIILDECKTVYHNKDEELQVEFVSEEPMTNVSVSIWVRTDSNFQIWYKHSYPIIREITTTMGITSTQGTIKSDWLETLKKNSVLKSKVNEAVKVAKSSYQSFSVGGYALDPWAKSDREFTDLITSLKPEKSGGAFFPKGWDFVSKQHGGLSFLEWFRDITADASDVVLQDPFFGTLGLEFLARTTNSSTHFTIITCTQIKSQDDKPKGTIRWVLELFNYRTHNKSKEPTRAKELKHVIEQSPVIFDSLQLQIVDLRSSGGGDKNLIHDRYLLILKKGVIRNGYHLSNSIQGATRSHPLLVTPIPKDILANVNQYLTDLINRSGSNSELQVINLYDSDGKRKKKNAPEAEIISNDDLYKKLIRDLPSEASVTNDYVHHLINSLHGNPTTRYKFWSTFGHFLAHITYSESVLKCVVEVITPSSLSNLRMYIEQTITYPYPIGFSNRKEYQHYPLHFLSITDFQKAVDEAILLEHHSVDSGAYGNWGAYFGVKILIRCSFDELLSLFKFLQNQVTTLGKDPTTSPVLMLSSMTVSQLVKKFFWYIDKATISKSLASNIQPIRGLSAAALISSIIDRDPDFEYNDIHILTEKLSPADRVIIYTRCLSTLRFKKLENNESLEAEIIEDLSRVLHDNFDVAYLGVILDHLLHKGYPGLEAKFTNGILLKLLDDGIIRDDQIGKIWQDEFEKLLKEPDKWRDDEGILDVLGWSVANIASDDYISLLKREVKKSQVEIFKPFKKGHNDWDTAFNRILMIRSTLMISILYNEKRNGTDIIKDIVDQINILEADYQPYHGSSPIRSHAKAIMEKYKSLKNEAK